MDGYNRSPHSKHSLKARLIFVAKYANEIYSKPERCVSPHPRVWGFAAQYYINERSIQFMVTIFHTFTLSGLGQYDIGCVT